MKVFLVRKCSFKDTLDADECKGIFKLILQSLDTFSFCVFNLPASSVTRFVDFMDDFGQLFKAFGNN